MPKRTYASILGSTLSYHLRTAKQCVGPDRLRPERLSFEVKAAAKIVSDFHSAILSTHPPSMLMGATSDTLGQVRALKDLVEVGSSDDRIYSQIEIALSAAELLLSIAQEASLEGEQHNN